MEKIKKLVLLSTFLLFPEILNAFQDIINPDVTTNRWIIESNTKYLNKASARSFKGELEAEIVVDISEQRLYLVKNKKILKSYPISSSKYGEGSIQNSFKTPLGMHEIKTKIGHGCQLEGQSKSHYRISFSIMPPLLLSWLQGGGGAEWQCRRQGT